MMFTCGSMRRSDLHPRLWRLTGAPGAFRGLTDESLVQKSSLKLSVVLSSDLLWFLWSPVLIMVLFQVLNVCPGPSAVQRRFAFHLVDHVVFPCS